MGKLQPAPVVGGAYGDDCAAWTDQDCVNWLPVVAEGQGTRSPSILRTPPGLQEFATVPSVRRQRGAYVAEGRPFVVMDSTLYTWTTTGSMRAIGTVPGVGRVQFTHNKVGSNIEVFIGAGAWGGIYSSDADTLTQITDDAFIGAKSVGYIGHLFLAVDTTGRSFRNSALDDGLSWNGLEFYEGESKPDRIVGIPQYAVNGEIPVFSERCIEHFSYTGETNAIFQRIPGTTLDRGCAATNAISALDNALFFIGDDGSGYEKRGYELKRITTHAIEQAWAECDIAKAYSFTWEDKGHKVWYVTFPDGHTWGYDVSCREWHRRESWEQDRWRLAWLVKWNGAWYGGEHNSGRIFRMVWGYVREGCDRMLRARTTGVLHDNQNPLTLDELEIVVKATGEATTCTSVFPLAFDPEQYTLDGVTFGGGLPDGAVGDVVDFWYTTIGGVGTITFAIDGTTPAGTSFDNGHITGTYTTAEHDNAWSVQATDEEGNSVTLVEAQYVMDMLGDPPNVDSGDAYDYALTGSEGTAPYTFALTTGVLPSAITLGSDGDFDGTAGDPDEEVFSVTMTDAAGVTQTKQYSILVRDTSAVTLFPGLLEWYEFNNVDTGSVNSGNQWLGNWGGSAVETYSAGLVNQQAIMTEVSRSPGLESLTTYSAGTAFSYWIVAYVDVSVSDTTEIGLARNTTPGIDRNPFNCIEITTSGAAGTARLHVFDYGPPQVYVDSATIALGASGYYGFAYTYTPGTKTVTLRVYNIATGLMGDETVTLLAHPPEESVFWLTVQDNPGKAAFDALPALKVNEFVLFYDVDMSQAQSDYLWNSGTPKTYAQFVADNA